MHFAMKLRFVFLSLLTVTTSGCDLYGVQHVEEPSRVVLAKEHLVLFMGADQGDEVQFPSSAQLSAQVLGTTDAPLSGHSAEVRWQSTDAAIASVDASGKVSAVATGSATLIATSVAKPAAVATMSVSVLDQGLADVVVR